VQLRVLSLSFFQDGDVRVGVFPECEEILILGAGFDGVALQREGAGQTEAGQRAQWKVDHQSVVVNELLKFRCCCVAVVQHEISLSAQINRAQDYIEAGVGVLAEFDRAHNFQ